MNIYLDESGYTRDNLIDPSQPFLCIATLRMDEERCKELRQRFFSNVQAPILKHSILAKTARNQALVLEFLKELAAWSDLVRSYLVHKRFALVCKFVDYLIEPHAANAGLNLYEGGQAAAIGCGLYYTLSVLPGHANGHSILQAFHDLLRERTPDRRAGLLRLLDEAARHPTLGKLFSPAVLVLRDSDFPHYLASLPERPFDLSFTCALTLLSGWRHTLGEREPIALVHDTSSVMAKESDWWQYLTSEDRSAFVDNAAVPLVFPVSIDTTEFGREDQFEGLQLVDIIAGAIAKGFTWMENRRPADDSYGQRLGAFFAEHSRQFVQCCMLPTRDIRALADDFAGSDAAPALAYIQEQMALRASGSE